MAVVPSSLYTRALRTFEAWVGVAMLLGTAGCGGSSNGSTEGVDASFGDRDSFSPAAQAWRLARAARPVSHERIPVSSSSSHRFGSQRHAHGA